MYLNRKKTKKSRRKNIYQSRIHKIQFGADKGMENNRENSLPKGTVKYIQNMHEYLY